ncbi:MAG: hypothetical protein ACRD1C_01555 [Terriglobales bacterium]
MLHFQVLKTQHFDIYFYPAEKAASEQAARMAERRYTRLSTLLHHVLTTRQAIILYASHTDFEQTTAVPGMIEPKMRTCPQPYPIPARCISLTQWGMCSVRSMPCHR